MYEWNLMLLIGAIATLVFVIVVGKKMHMNIHYMIVWVLWAFLIIILSIFPSILDFIANILGIATPALAILFIFIFLVYIICYYLFIKASNFNDRINKLTYEVAQLKKELEEKNKRG